MNRSTFINWVWITLSITQAHAKAGSGHRKTRYSHIRPHYKYQVKLLLSPKLLLSQRTVSFNYYQKPHFWRLILTLPFGLTNLFLETGSTYLGREGSYQPAGLWASPFSSPCTQNPGLLAFMWEKEGASPHQYKLWTSLRIERLRPCFYLSIDKQPLARAA